MERCKIFVFLVLILSCVSLTAQSVLPQLKDNQTAKVLIQKQIENLYYIHKSAPSKEIAVKIGLYEMAVGFLEEASIIPTTTDYALTSAFLNTEVNNGNIMDAEALMRFNRKQWNQNFIDLVNLVKQ